MMSLPYKYLVFQTLEKGNMHLTSGYEGMLALKYFKGSPAIAEVVS